MNRLKGDFCEIFSLLNIPPMYTALQFATLIYINFGTGNPNNVFRCHSYKLTDAITTNLYRLTDALHAKGLIPLDTKRDMYSVSGDNELKKAGKLLITLQTLMKSSQHPEQYLIDTCNVLVNQQNQALTDIATSMMKQLGKR